MDTEIINCFMVLSDTLSFTKASQILHKSQSVLSRQIASFENEIGFALFIRDTKSCALTLAGTRMKAGLEELTGYYSRLLDECQKIERGYKGRLIISMPAGEFNRFYPMLIQPFQNEHPDINLQLTTYSIPSLSEKIKSGKIDVAFAVQTSPWFPSVNSPDYRHISIGLKRDCLFIPSTHPMADKNPQSLRLTDFKDDTFLVIKDFEIDIKNGPTYKLLSSYGIVPNIQPVQTLEDLICNMMCNQGITISTSRLLLYDNPNFKKLFLSELESHTEIVMWNTDNSNPCISVFAQWLRNYISENPDYVNNDHLLTNSIQ